MLSTRIFALWIGPFVLVGTLGAQLPAPAGGHGELFDPSLVQQLGVRCGTPPRAAGPTLEALLGSSDCAYFSTTIDPAYDPTYVYQIPVVVHVIEDSSGNGHLSEAAVQSQIDILNEDFRALPGTNGSLGTDTKIQFKLATEDPSGSPTNGITYSTNSTWYHDGGNYWSSLAWDTDRYLNIYTNDAGGYLGYVPDLPQGGIVGSTSDRVVVYWASVGRNSPFPPYDQGRTVTHEVGHYLGLWHPFDFGCGSASAPACYSDGDLICDTNTESSPVFGCPGSSSSCGTSDPFRNYMDYTDDLCMQLFTFEQANRMRCTIEHWRPDLASACFSQASVASRNAGSNPNSFTASMPAFADSIDFIVNLLSTGHTSALIIGFHSPTNVTLGAGQVLLTNVADPAGEMLTLPVLPGPIASTSVPIALDTELCGLEIYAQALHFGGVTPFALSNAQDLVIGF